MQKYLDKVFYLERLVRKAGVDQATQRGVTSPSLGCYAIDKKKNVLCASFVPQALVHSKYESKKNLPLGFLFVLFFFFFVHLFMDSSPGVHVLVSAISGKLSF